MASKTEKDIEVLEARIVSIQEEIEQLEEKKLAEEAVMASTTSTVRALAIQIHQVMCTLSHSDAEADCHWSTIEAADLPEVCDWTERDHALWLTRAKLGVGGMRTLGFEVIDPAEDP